MCRRRRRMFAMMHLCNFRQVYNEEVRQMMTRSPVKVPLSTETVKGVGLRLETLELRTPCENFLATPLLCRATDEAHSVARLSLLGADDLERTARRSPPPVAQCRWLPANVKDSSIVHQILVYSARLICMKLRYIRLLHVLTLTFGSLMTLTHVT